MQVGTAFAIKGFPALGTSKTSLVECVTPALLV